MIVEYNATVDAYITHDVDVETPEDGPPTEVTPGVPQSVLIQELLERVEKLEQAAAGE